MSEILTELLLQGQARAMEKESICLGDGTTCAECGKVFSHPFYFSTHISAHTIEKNFAVVGQCALCGLIFSDPEVFTAHLNSSQSRMESQMAQACSDVDNTSNFLDMDGSTCTNFDLSSSDNISEFSDESGIKQMARKRTLSENSDTDNFSDSNHTALGESKHKRKRKVPLKFQCGIETVVSQSPQDSDPEVEAYLRSLSDMGLTVDPEAFSSSSKGRNRKGGRARGGKGKKASPDFEFDRPKKSSPKYEYLDCDVLLEDDLEVLPKSGKMTRGERLQQRQERLSQTQEEGKDVNKLRTYKLYADDDEYNKKKSKGGRRRSSTVRTVFTNEAQNSPTSKIKPFANVEVTKKTSSASGLIERPQCQNPAPVKTTHNFPLAPRVPIGGFKVQGLFGGQIRSQQPKVGNSVHQNASGHLGCSTSRKSHSLEDIKRDSREYVEQMLQSAGLMSISSALVNKGTHSGNGGGMVSKYGKTEKFGSHGQTRSENSSDTLSPLQTYYYKGELKQWSRPLGGGVGKFVSPPSSQASRLGSNKGRVSSSSLPGFGSTKSSPAPPLAPGERCISLPVIPSNSPGKPVISNGAVPIKGKSTPSPPSRTPPPSRPPQPPTGLSQGGGRPGSSVSKLPMKPLLNTSEVIVIDDDDDDDDDESEAEKVSSFKKSGDAISHGPVAERGHRPDKGSLNEKCAVAVVDVDKQGQTTHIKNIKEKANRFSPVLAESKLKDNKEEKFSGIPKEHSNLKGGGHENGKDMGLESKGDESYLEGEEDIDGWKVCLAQNSDSDDEEVSTLYDNNLTSLPQSDQSPVNKSSSPDCPSPKTSSYSFGHTTEEPSMQPAKSVLDSDDEEIISSDYPSEDSFKGKQSSPPSSPSYTCFTGENHSSLPCISLSDSSKKAPSTSSGADNHSSWSTDLKLDSSNQDCTYESQSSQSKENSPLVKVSSLLCDQESDQGKGSLSPLWPPSSHLKAKHNQSLVIQESSKQDHMQQTQPSSSSSTCIESDTGTVVEQSQNAQDSPAIEPSLNRLGSQESSSPHQHLHNMRFETPESVDSRTCLNSDRENTEVSMSVSSEVVKSCPHPSESDHKTSECGHSSSKIKNKSSFVSPPVTESVQKTTESSALSPIVPDISKGSDAPESEHSRTSDLSGQSVEFSSQSLEFPTPMGGEEKTGSTGNYIEETSSLLDIFSEIEKTCKEIEGNSESEGSCSELCAENKPQGQDKQVQSSATDKGGQEGSSETRKQSGNELDFREILKNLVFDNTAKDSAASNPESVLSGPGHAVDQEEDAGNSTAEELNKITEDISSIEKLCEAMNDPVDTAEKEKSIIDTALEDEDGFIKEERICQSRHQTTSTEMVEENSEETQVHLTGLEREENEDKDGVRLEVVKKVHEKVENESGSSATSTTNMCSEVLVEQEENSGGDQDNQVLNEKSVDETLGERGSQVTEEANEWNNVPAKMGKENRAVSEGEASKIMEKQDVQGSLPVKNALTQEITENEKVDEHDKRGEALESKEVHAEGEIKGEVTRIEEMETGGSDEVGEGDSINEAEVTPMEVEMEDVNDTEAMEGETNMDSSDMTEDITTGDGTEKDNCVAAAGMEVVDEAEQNGCEDASTDKNHRSEGRGGLQRNNELEFVDGSIQQDNSQLGFVEEPDDITSEPGKTQVDTKELSMVVADVVNVVEPKLGDRMNSDARSEDTVELKDISQQEVQLVGKMGSTEEEQENEEKRKHRSTCKEGEEICDRDGRGDDDDDNDDDEVHDKSGKGCRDFCGSGSRSGRTADSQGSLASNSSHGSGEDGGGGTANSSSPENGSSNSLMALCSADLNARQVTTSEPLAVSSIGHINGGNVTCHHENSNISRCNSTDSYYSRSICCRSCVGDTLSTRNMHIRAPSSSRCHGEDTHERKTSLELIPLVDRGSWLRSICMAGAGRWCAVKDQSVPSLPLQTFDKVTCVFGSNDTVSQKCEVICAGSSCCVVAVTC